MHRCGKPEWSHQMKGLKLRLVNLYFIFQNQPSPVPFTYLSPRISFGSYLLSLSICFMVKGFLHLF